MMETGYPEGWEEVDGALERKFRFKAFPSAIAFVNRVAEAAEEANHHPDIAVHYSRVVAPVLDAHGERDHRPRRRRAARIGGARQLHRR